MVPFANRLMEISNTSGLAGVAYWVNRYVTKRGGTPYDKNDQVIVDIYSWVTSQYDAGRITMISDDELVEQYLIALKNNQ